MSMGKFFVYLNCFFKGIDLATTYVFVTKFGSMEEWNPIWQVAINEIGLFRALVLNAFVSSLSLWILFKVDKLMPWVILSIILGLTALWNIIYVFVVF